MNGFDLLKRDKKQLITNNLFSVPCVISNGTEEQETRCLGNFIGLQITSEGSNNIAVINDTSEACINYDDITIGRPKANWTLSFIQGGTDKMINFRIDNVMEDKTMGVYRLKLSLLKKDVKNSDDSDNGNNDSNSNSNTNQIIHKPIIRRNGGL
jgi:hypothetical protein